MEAGREFSRTAGRDGRQETGINKKQKNTTRKIQSNDILANLGHPGDYRMHTTANHLHYILKGALEGCENCAMAKRKQKWLHKVVEERDLKMGEMIYLDLRSQEKNLWRFQELDPHT